MIRRLPPRGRDRIRPLLRRLERAVDGLNAILVVVALGLALLDLSVAAALELPHLPLR